MGLAILFFSAWKAPFSLLLLIGGVIDQSKTPLRLILSPPLTTKVLFVILKFANWTLRGDEAETTDSHIN